MPRRADDFRGLTQPNRMRLLRALQREAGRTAQDLAAECDLPVNTVRDHLAVMEDEGLIVRETVRTGTRGRPPVVFHPVRSSGASATADRRVDDARRRGGLYRAMTPSENDDLDPATQAQLDVLYEHLDDAGLDPAFDERTLTVDLAPCNYHGLIDQDQPMVCAVHARLVGDVLQQAGGPLEMKRLLPFVTEHSCRLMLTRRTPPPSDGSPGETPGEPGTGE